jgi:hypothetical protein
MSTENQINANRLNAQKSTGPKTPEGKEKVSQNAITHGLCSTRPVLSTEDSVQYDQFRDDFFRRHTPEGALENVLAERAVNTFWRLRRASTFETLIVNSLLGQAIDAIKEKFAGNPNFRLSDLTSQDYLAVVVENDFSREHILERVQGYETKIERSYYRTLKELRKLQTQRLQQNNSDAGARRRKPSDISNVGEASPLHNKNTQNKANLSTNKLAIPHNDAKTPIDNRKSSIVNPLPLSNSPEMNTLAPDVLKALMKNNPRFPKMLTMAM